MQAGCGRGLQRAPKCCRVSRQLPADLPNRKTARVADRPPNHHTALNRSWLDPSPLWASVFPSVHRAVPGSYMGSRQESGPGMAQLPVCSHQHMVPQASPGAALEAPAVPGRPWTSSAAQDPTAPCSLARTRRPIWLRITCGALDPLNTSWTLLSLMKRRPRPRVGLPSPFPLTETEHGKRHQVHHGRTGRLIPT